MGNPEKNSSKVRSPATSFELHGASKAVQQSFWLTLLGSILVIRGVMFFLNPQVATLECDRLDLAPELSLCELGVSTLQKETLTTIPLAQLEKAEVQKQGKSSQLVLLTTNGKVYFPINNGFSSTEEKADQINAFVKDLAADSLKVEQDNRWLVYPLGASLIALGGWMLGFNYKGLLNRFQDSQ